MTATYICYFFLRLSERLKNCYSSATGSSVRVAAHFSDVENATTLLLSDDGATLYVGARNAILSLNVSQPGVLTLKHKVGIYWTKIVI